MQILSFDSISKFEFKIENVQLFEEKFKVKIPNNLVSFLKKQNGGELSSCFFKNLWVTDFFPINDNRYGTIWQTYEYLLSEDIYEMIPFAGDPDTKSYCLSINENTFGQVFCYKGGDWIEGESPLFQISDTFEEFIKGIKNISS